MSRLCALRTHIRSLTILMQIHRSCHSQLTANSTPLMSTLRERKAISAFASAQAAADATYDPDAVDADAAIARAASSSASNAAAASSDATAAAAAPSAADVSPLGTSWVRFIPFAFLFMLVFVSVSLLTTGTMHYGLEPALRPHMRHWARSFNSAQINLQESLGLRAPSVAKQRRQQQQQRAANTGYGGVTRKPKKGAAAAGATPQEGTAPPSEVAAPADEPVWIEPRPLERDPHALYLTPSQLAEYDGRDGGPVFLAVYGRVFDVSAGRDHYGPGGGYASLAARDSSRAFATNCYRSKADQSDLRGLTPEQMKAIDHWYKFYNEHEKYTAVGWVDKEPINEDAPMPKDEC